MLNPHGIYGDSHSQHQFGTVVPATGANCEHLQKNEGDMADSIRGWRYNLWTCQPIHSPAAPVDTSQQITRILSAVSRQAPDAAEQLLNAVYDELHRLAAAKMANESPAHTLQATALINEAWPRLLQEGSLPFTDRRNFLAAAAEAMRRVLIDHARRRNRQRRGGGSRPLDLDSFEVAAPESSEELLRLNEALEQLEKLDETRSEIVKLRFFAGLTNRETAETLGLPLRTVERHWTFARAWLKREMSDGG